MSEPLSESLANNQASPTHPRATNLTGMYLFPPTNSSHLTCFKHLTCFIGGFLESRGGSHLGQQHGGLPPRRSRKKVASSWLRTKCGTPQRRLSTGGARRPAEAAGRMPPGRGPKVPRPGHAVEGAQRGAGLLCLAALVAPDGAALSIHLHLLHGLFARVSRLSARRCCRPDAPTRRQRRGGVAGQMSFCLEARRGGVAGQIGSPVPSRSSPPRG